MQNMWWNIVFTFVLASLFVCHYVDFRCSSIHLEDNCIQYSHLGRYIVGYTVENLVSWQHASGAVKYF